MTHNVEVSDLYPIVTICGSMRFYDFMLDVARIHTENGFIVLMPHSVKNPNADKAALDAMHRAKIDMSSEIIICTDTDVYIGESTRAEMLYAASKNVKWRFALTAPLTTRNDTAVPILASPEFVPRVYSADDPTREYYAIACPNGCLYSVAHIHALNADGAEFTFADGTYSYEPYPT